MIHSPAKLSKSTVLEMQSQIFQKVRSLEIWKGCLLEKRPSMSAIRVGSVRLDRRNRAYAESEVGEPLAIIGSFGMLEIAVNGGR